MGVIADPAKIAVDWVKANLSPVEKIKGGKKVFAKEVYEAYKQACRAKGQKPLIQSELGRHINQTFPGAKFKTMGGVAYRLELCG